jgi:RNA polymerase sigma-70 factor (ECF subfamily)
MRSRPVVDTVCGDEASRRVGDDAAALSFGALYRQHVAPVYRFCYRRLGAREAAEDATAQVFAQALAAWPTFRGGSVPGWLFAIAHHVVIDERRRDRPHLTLAAATTVCDPLPGPEATAVAADEARTIRALLAQLPPAQRQVLELRLAGLSGSEIAEALGRTHGTIRNLQHRTLTRLRGLLAAPSSQEHTVDA